ncbi:MAG: hypothetical protein ACYSX1_08275 [Planctomycetota bacterium]
MWRKKRRTQVVLFAAVAVVISRLALWAADAPGNEQKVKSGSEPVLYLCRADSNSSCENPWTAIHPGRTG